MTRAKTLLNLIENVETCDGLRVIVNPSDLARIMKDLNRKPEHEHHEIRILGHVPSGEIYVFDGYYETHFGAAKKIGVDYDECILAYLMWMNPAHKDMTGVEGWTLSESSSYRVKELPLFSQVWDKIKRLVT